MKKMFGLILFTISLSAIAEVPLFYMEKRSSGFTPPEYAFRKICEVSKTKATITLQNISGETVTEKNITMDPTWIKLIQKASTGAIKEILTPYDFGYLEIYAFQNENGYLIRGYDDDGFGLINISPAAQALEEIILKICQK